MQRILVSTCLLFLTLGHMQAACQTTCGIWFEYDPVGNRVVRYHDCKRPEPYGDPMSNAALLSKSATGTGPGNSAEKHSVVANWAEQSAEGVLSKGITVSPNPTSGNYTIRLDYNLDKRLHFHWYSEQGKILGSGNISASSYQGSIGTWADGMYWIRIYDGDRIIGNFKITKLSSAR